MLRRIVSGLAATALVVGTAGSAAAVPEKDNGGSRVDLDVNGIPDVGVVVTGHFEALHAYDASGASYWDQGFGRIVGSLDDLDQASLTTCYYIVTYRGTFENTPYQDSGWIRNNIRCEGAEPGTYNSNIVHETDPRYTGNPDLAIWGEWEYAVDTWSGVGNVANVVRPETHLG